MFDKLVQIFSESHPMQDIGEQFAKMQIQVRDMIGIASAVYWGRLLSPQERQELYETDVQVNQLQRDIRKALVVHMTGASNADVPYGLLIMSLVKDAERLGDYAKNLSEVHLITDLGAGDLPDGEIRDELRKIANFVEMISAQAADVYASGDHERAQALAKEGRAAMNECEEILKKVARSKFSAALAVNITMAARFYKRLGGHQLNILTSVFMPLHKLDYVDDEPPNSLG
jgi:phosphate uptake regulator